MTNIISTLTNTETKQKNPLVIDVLTQELERSTRRLESLKLTIDAAKEALRNAQSSIQLEAHTRRATVRTLALTGAALGVDIDWHSLGENCDEPSCRQCCEHEFQAFGNCKLCGAADEGAA